MVKKEGSRELMCKFKGNNILAMLFYAFLLQTFFCTDNPVSSSNYDIRELNCSTPTPFNGPRSNGIQYFCLEMYSSKNEVVYESYNSYISDHYQCYNAKEIQWKGKDLNGNIVKAGYYTIKVSSYYDNEADSNCNEVYISEPIMVTVK